MKASRTKSLELVLSEEGGYVNHPKDPGGPTNKGVTQKVYDAYRASVGKVSQSVQLISVTELGAIYWPQYWDKVRGDDLPAGLDYAMFDYAVNSGPSRAVKDLQRALGIAVDGSIGLITLQAVAAADDYTLTNDLCSRRLAFLKSLRTWSTFGRGWAARVERVRSGATAMIRAGSATAAGIEATPPATPMGSASAPESSQAALKTKTGIGAAIAGSGVTGQTLVSAAQNIQPQIGDTVFGRLALAGFVFLMVVGGAIVAWEFYSKYKEKLA